VKIATFNINSIRNRFANLLAWLEAARPDVACLQELRIWHEEFPLERLREAGYGAVWRGQQPRFNGVAVLALDATPELVCDALPGDAADPQARYIEARVHGVRVGCLYAPNGNPQPGPKFDYKLRWMDRLIAHARPLHAADEPVVLAGDYNIVPTDFDIYALRSYADDALVQPASREKYQAMLAQGWVDALRTQHPDERIYTYWDYMRKRWERDAGLRIDHLLLNAALAPRLRAAGVDKAVRGAAGASDHAPAWIEID
jgi:exodeoxyribonuclease-3